MDQRSVLQDWVMRLPLRHQGTLLTGVRGCDLAPKTDANLASLERHLVAFLRWCFMVPADDREVDAKPGCWFRSIPPRSWRPSALMHYPLHWYSHLMHAFEVVGYCHPDGDVAEEGLRIYLAMARALHLEPEDRSEFYDRLTEDRISTGTVVS